MSLLLLLLLLPLVGALIVLFLPSWNLQRIRNITLNVTLINFFLSLLLWLRFDNSTSKFQFVCNFTPFETATTQPATLTFGLGIDGISLFFIILTCFLFPACILVGWTTVQTAVKEYCIAFLLLETLLLAVFSVMDLLLFYVFFESVLIPMFVIIGVWGSRERRIRAAYQFFLYTLLGSVLMLLAILLLYFQAGTTDLQTLYTVQLSEERELLLWIAFFASFAVKVPMVPVHIWLPEAHVEAPTAGSVILAGILLKLATYGFLRVSIPLLPSASLYFTPLVYTLSCVAIIYTSFTTLRQVDLKKIIAYSSVAHMNFVTLGLFTLNSQGVEGAIMLMLSHGFVSPAFSCSLEHFMTATKQDWFVTTQGVPAQCRYLPFYFSFLLWLIAVYRELAALWGEFLIINGAFQTNTLYGPSFRDRNGDRGGLLSLALQPSYIWAP